MPAHRFAIPEPTLYDLAFLGCSNRQIAEAVGCAPSVLTRRADLVRDLASARADRAAATERAWLTRPPGALRSGGRAGELVAMIAAADSRAVRMRPINGQAPQDP